MNTKNNYFIDNSSLIGEGCEIYPGVVVEKNCKIGNNVKIQNSSLISNNVLIEDNCFIGPFTIIRENSIIKKDSVIGPHCEIVRSTISKNCKIYHRTFIGDATISEHVQIGCGTVVANSNFKDKFKTFIGERTVVGASVTLVSPITIGENCFIAAGSIVTQNLENNTFFRLDLKKIIKKN